MSWSDTITCSGVSKTLCNKSVHLNAQRNPKGFKETNWAWWGETSRVIWPWTEVSFDASVVVVFTCGSFRFCSWPAPLIDVNTHRASSYQCVQLLTDRLSGIGPNSKVNPAFTSSTCLFSSSGPTYTRLAHMKNNWGIVSTSGPVLSGCQHQRILAGLCLGVEVWRCMLGQTFWGAALCFKASQHRFKRAKICCHFSPCCFFLFFFITLLISVQMWL